MFSFSLVKKIFFITLISLFILAVFEIFSKIFYPYFVTPIIINNQVLKNIDWIVIPKTIECVELGYDIYVNNICDPLNRNHSYGSISLFLPFFNSLNTFYIKYFPFIMKFLFIFTIIFNFSYKKNIEYLILIVFFLSAPFLLIYERSNTDILVFILVFFIANIKNFFFNFFIILYLSLYKFFPIASSINFFFFKKIKNSFILFLIILLLVLFSDFSKLNYFLNNNTYNIHPYSSFSFYGLPELFISYLKNDNLLNFLLIKIYNFFNFEIEFQFFKFFFIKLFSYTIFFVPLIFIFILIFKRIKLLLNRDNNEDIHYSVKSSFLISSSIILFCYFIFPSFYYKEVFIIFLFPYFIFLSSKQNNFYNFLIKFILLKMIITSLTLFIVNYYSGNILITGFSTGFRHLVDLFFIIFLSMVTIKFYKSHHFFNK